MLWAASEVKPTLAAPNIAGIMISLIYVTTLSPRFSNSNIAAQTYNSRRVEGSTSSLVHCSSWRHFSTVRKCMSSSTRPTRKRARKDQGRIDIRGEERSGATPQSTQMLAKKGGELRRIYCGVFFILNVDRYTACHLV